MQVIVEHRDRLVLRFFVEIDEANIEPLVLARQPRVPEVLEAFHRLAGARLRDINRTLESPVEVVEHALERVDVRRGEHHAHVEGDRKPVHVEEGHEREDVLSADLRLLDHARV